ncbi:MAG: signal peptidase I [Bacilli bacterium]|nr:signal peptidase I [Bacilli bacterium]
MKLNNKITILCLIIYGYVLIYQTFILSHLLRYSDFINAAMMIILTALAIIFLGYKKDNPRELKFEIMQKTIFLVVTFFLISYALGLVIGFNRNAYSLKPFMILRNIICPLTILISMEIYRYVLVNSTNNKKLLYFGVFSLFIFETFISIRVSGLSGLLPIFTVVTTQVLPYLAKNVVLSILAKHGGMKPCIFYRILMEMYIYVLPIIPNFGDYITSMVGICFPIILYISVLGNINEYVNPITNMMDTRLLKQKYNPFDYATFAFLVIFITLISGLFPFTLVAIGSDSMSPVISKGDAIVYQKVVSEKKLKEGQIVVYKNPNPDKDTLIVHRLVRIEKTKDGYVYRTKGDSNNGEDNVDLTIKDIKGTVCFKIKYIGYPTLFISSLFKKK